MPPPICAAVRCNWCRPDTRTRWCCGVTGAPSSPERAALPIGLLPGLPYSQFDLSMEAGDRLLLYSDGFTECRLRNGKMLEPEGLIDLARKCASDQSGQEFLDDLFWQLTQVMSMEHGMEDDVSATLFEFGGL